jgi:hypothetical protein
VCTPVQKLVSVAVRINVLLEIYPPLIDREAKLNSSRHMIPKQMMEFVRSAVLVALLACSGLLQPIAIRADLIPVRHTEGLTHGFLELQTLDGNTIADGDLTKITKGDRVTNHMVFHFKDGSVSDETSVFTQRGTFRLLSDHLIQKGPAFKQPMETTLDAASGRVTAHYTDSDGKVKVVDEILKLPPDVANGIIPVLLNNVQPNVQQITVSMVVPTPKPRLVKLVVTPAGEDSFSVGGSSRKATRYLLKMELGGVTGVVAPLVGKQPPDTSVWILGGDAPAFLKSEGPQFEGGPIWRIETVSPVWPKSPSQK